MTGINVVADYNADTDSYTYRASVPEGRSIEFAEGSPEFEAYSAFLNAVKSTERRRVYEIEVTKTHIYRVTMPLADFAGEPGEVMDRLLTRVNAEQEVDTFIGAVRATDVASDKVLYDDHE